ncbi:MAG: hypothetical protein ACKO9I_14800 [Sphaerospermopsis kisseleviana]
MTGGRRQEIKESGVGKEAGEQGTGEQGSREQGSRGAGNREQGAGGKRFIPVTSHQSPVTSHQSPVTSPYSLFLRFSQYQ